MAGFSEDVHHFFHSIHEYRDFEYFFQIANEWSHVSHILEREEFQAAMREEVGAIPLYTTDLDKIEFLMYSLMLVLLPSRQKMEESGF